MVHLWGDDNRCCRQRSQENDSNEKSQVVLGSFHDSSLASNISERVVLRFSQLKQLELFCLRTSGQKILLLRSLLQLVSYF